jgi:hypothetical protein
MLLHVGNGGFQKAAKEGPAEVAIESRRREHG